MKTPTTLREAIENALNEEYSESKRVARIKTHVHDFLAHKFGSLMLRADDDSSRLLLVLFKDITQD